MGWLADRVDVRKIHLSEVPQTWARPCGGDASAPLLAQSWRGLSVRPLMIDLGRDYRGGQHQALLLLQGLLARGHEPQLLTLADSGLANDARNAGIATRVVPRAWRQIRSAGAIRDLLAEH